MNPPRRSFWLPAALLAGALYFVIGRYFPNPAENPGPWRLAAWVLSGAVFAAHIGWERFRLRSAPLPLALRAAAAVALGGFALAVAAMMHSLSVDGAIRPVWYLALVL